MHQRRGLFAGFVVFGLLVLSPAVAAPGLTPYEALYKIKISFVTGELTAKLTRTETGYEAVHRVEPTGLAGAIVHGDIEESSGFELTPDGVKPVHYTSADGISSKKTQADLTFDWTNHRIEGRLNGEPFDMPFDGKALDRISIQYAMMYDMIVGETGKSYTLFDIDKFKNLEIEILGKKEVEVPAGRFQAIGVRHQTKGSSRVTTLWCVPELGYLPAVIEQHKKGKPAMRAVLATYEAHP